MKWKVESGKLKVKGKTLRVLKSKEIPIRNFILNFPLSIFHFQLIKGGKNHAGHH